MRGARKHLLVEGWRRHECIAFRRVQRATTARTTADTYALDRSCDYVQISLDRVGVVAQWQITGGWKFSSITPDDLRVALTSEDR